MELHTHWWGIRIFPEDRAEQSLIECLYHLTKDNVAECYEDGEITLEYNQDGIHLDFMKITR